MIFLTRKWNNFFMYSISTQNLPILVVVVVVVRTLRCVALTLSARFLRVRLCERLRERIRVRVRVINVQNKTCKSIEWYQPRAKYNYYVMFLIFYVNKTLARHHQRHKRTIIARMCSSICKPWHARVSDGTNIPSSKFYLLLSALFFPICLHHTAENWVIPWKGASPQAENLSDIRLEPHKAAYRHPLSIMPDQLHHNILTMHRYRRNTRSSKDSIGDYNDFHMKSWSPFTLCFWFPFFLGGGGGGGNESIKYAITLSKCH